MFRQELETVGGGTQEHLAQSQPVARVRRGHERFEVVTAAKRRRSQVHALRRPLQQPDRDVAVREGLPFEKEAPGPLDALQDGQQTVSSQLTRSRERAFKDDPSLTCESEPQCSKP